MVLVGIVIRGGVIMADVAFIGVMAMLGSGTADDPYQIRTAEQLADLSAKVAANDSGYIGKNYIQTANISLSGYANWTPIGTSTNRFAGVFDGNGLQISNLTSTGTRNALFGYVTGTLKNIIVESGTVTGTTYESICAGICVSISSAAVISGCINKASVVGVSTGTSLAYIGGVLGYHLSSSSISNCANFGSIVQNSTSSAVRTAGGIVGYSASGGSLINNCFNAGTITGNGELQAISGKNGSLSNCYYDSTTSGATEGAATGRATAYCQGTDALSNVDKLSGLGTTGWKPLTGYPVPIKTR